jgi:L-asparagine transporter-like permease
MAQPATDLKRVLPFRNLFFIALCLIIGAGGVFLTSVAIGTTGPSLIPAYFAAWIPL